MKRRIVIPNSEMHPLPGESQADAIVAILEAAGWSDISNTKDLAGLPRVTAATWKQ